MKVLAKTMRKDLTARADVCRARSLAWLAYSRGMAGLAGLVLCTCLTSVTRAQTTWKWTIETVDTSARFTSLAVDAEGSVHVAYASGAGDYELKYAFRPAGTSRWFNMMLEKQFSTFTTDIAVDGNGNPRICFAPRQMKFASWDGKAWHIQEIDPGKGTAEYNCSVAIGPDGTPHLTWYQTRGPGGQNFLHIKYATLQGGVWLARTIDFDRECGKWNSVVLDAGGLPHVAYSVFPPGELKYGYSDGKDWHFAQVDAPSRGVTRLPVGMGVSLAKDPHQQFVMSFYEAPYSDSRDPGALKVARFVDGHWKLEKVDQVYKSEGWAEYRSNVAFDKTGSPHVGYEDGGSLKHAYWDGERWKVQLLVGGGNEATIYSSMKIGLDDTIYISYRDPVDGSLKVAVGRPGPAEAQKSAVAQPSDKHQ
jgi:hypothetical protein